MPKRRTQHVQYVRRKFCTPRSHTWKASFEGTKIFLTIAVVQSCSNSAGYERACETCTAGGHNTKKDAEIAGRPSCFSQDLKCSVRGSLWYRRGTCVVGRFGWVTETWDTRQLIQSTSKLRLDTKTWQHIILPTSVRHRTAVTICSEGAGRT